MTNTLPMCFQPSLSMLRRSDGLVNILQKKGGLWAFASSSPPMIPKIEAIIGCKNNRRLSGPVVRAIRSSKMRVSTSSISKSSEPKEHVQNCEQADEDHS